jgi:hypothetical protein
VRVNVSCRYARENKHAYSVSYAQIARYRFSQKTSPLPKITRENKYTVNVSTVICKHKINVHMRVYSVMQPCMYHLFRGYVQQKPR